MRADVRRSMEPAFGADFSAVRIHTGTRAQHLSAQIGADAFTAAHNVFIGRSDFDPSTAAGTELLAHELTHVVQQNGTGGAAQRRTVIRRRLSAESDKAFTTATRSNPTYGTKKATVDKYPNTDIDNVTLDEQKELNDVSSTWKTRRRTKKVRTGEEGEAEQLEALADLIRARNLAEFAERTVALRAAPVGPNEKYTSEGAKAKRRKFYLTKANEQKKKDRNLLRLGVAAPETREYLNEHGFHQAARDVVTTINPLGPAKDSTKGPKTRPDSQNPLGVTTSQDVKEWARGPRIDVRSTFIGGPILGIRVRAHLFVVYTSRQGQQFYFRGGPDEDGHTVADYGPYTSDTIDYDPSAPSVTVMQGPDAEGKLDALVHATQRINAMKVPYLAAIAPGKLKKATGIIGDVAMGVSSDGENCNRTAWTILDRAGVPVKKPGGKHPGWGKPLGSSVKGEKEMEPDDHDVVDPPIPHVITADEGGGAGVVQSYIDRAFFVKGPKLAVGTKVTIIAEGRTYRTYQMGSAVHFVKKTALEQEHSVNAEVRSWLVAMGATTDRIKFLCDDDDDGWDTVVEIADELGIDDPNEVLRALQLELAVRDPGDELVYLKHRLDQMTDAQVKEMATNLPRLGHFAKEVGVSAQQVLTAVRARLAKIAELDRMKVKILAVAPDPQTLNRVANDYPDYPDLDQLASDLGKSTQEVLDVIDDLRPPEHRGKFLHEFIDQVITADMLEDLQDGSIDPSNIEQHLGVGAGWLLPRLIEFCESLQIDGAVDPSQIDPATYAIKFFDGWGGSEAPKAVVTLDKIPKTIDVQGAMRSEQCVSVEFLGFTNVSLVDFEILEKWVAGDYDGKAKV